MAPPIAAIHGFFITITPMPLLSSSIGGRGVSLYSCVADVIRMGELEHRVLAFIGQDRRLPAALLVRADDGPANDAIATGESLSGGGAKMRTVAPSIGLLFSS